MYQSGNNISNTLLNRIKAYSSFVYSVWIALCNVDEGLEC